MSNKYKVVGMFSGGLDSILAHRIMVREGFEVIGIHFYTGFNGDLGRDISHGPFWKWDPPHQVVESALRLGIRLLPMDVGGEDYLDILANPCYGYGSAANPCQDCRIYLLKKAKEVMEAEDAILVFTGEVLGQRPMSQMRPTLAMVMKKSGLEGRLLRPLSAKLLEPTIPEQEGIVNREHLYGFSGRSRKPQQELAGELGITGYPSSGGGCHLTDEGFGRKFKDLLAHLGDHRLTLRDLNSIKTGRHLRLPGGLKVILGRNEFENAYLEELLREDTWIFNTVDFPGAFAFVPGEPSGDDFRHVAAITARYSKAREQETVRVLARRGGETREFTVRPAKQEEIEQYFVS
ncbi:MAG: thiamine biosynthesis protein [Candidatus Latescibacterota bacterium]